MVHELEDVAVVVRPGLDNVAAVVADDLPMGLELQVDGQRLLLPQSLRRGQSVALREIQAGEPVVSLGAPYGTARRRIAPGERVDAANVAAELPKRARERSVSRARKRSQAFRELTFEGYRRPDGRAGARNYVGIITSGMCAATEVREIAWRAQRELYSREKYPHVDGVVPIVHESGCGMPDGRAVDILNRVLSECLSHPNLGAVLYVDLGCGKTCVECSVPVFQSRVNHYDSRVVSLGIQASGGTRPTIERGLAIVRDLLERANQCRRETVSASNLLVGVKCGGSDRWSGITANPALGWAADRLVEAGGGVLIGEVPELQGAAHSELIRRAASREVARKLNAAQKRYERYVHTFGDDYRENPSPGNIEGGLSNIFLKSLGALAKAGHSPLADVLDYGEPAGDRRGLMVVYSPGYDQISTPALFLGGAQVACFTTGRGTGIGCALGPVLKIASNSELARRNEDMDLDAGPILGVRDAAGFRKPGSGVPIEQVGEQILQRILETASGRYIPRAEASGLHHEFKVWESLWPSL